MPSPRAATPLALAAALLCAAAAYAAESLELTLEQALERARSRAPAALAAQERVDEARGALLAASPLLRDNPVVEGSFGPRTPLAGPGARSYDLELGLSQTVELGGKRGARLAVAHAQVARAEAEREAALRAHLGAVAERFLGALHARARVELGEARLQTARTLRSATERRLAAGESAALEANAARIEAVEAEAELLAARADEAALLNALRGLLGVARGDALVLRGTLRDVVLAADTDVLEGPTAAPPGVRAREAELAEAQGERRVGTSAAWPDVGLGVRYEREEGDQVVLGVLSVPLPVFERGQGARASAAARARRAAVELDAARATADLEVASVRERYARTREAAALYEREALPALTENERLVQRALEVGELGLAELLVWRRTAADTREAYLRRLLDAASARVALRLQLGAY